ncbi:hypothetical protein Ddc_15102 [Ditylenchus destructor]|nr:hypothetical protein Ddc_15102 [Ditylenchus destructor]
MSHPLDFDLLRSVLQFLDRKQLSILSAGSNQRIHSLIGREFGNTPPYFLFAWLRYFHNYIYKTKQGNLCRIHEITEQSKSDDDFNRDEFFAFLANCKFIRSCVTSINPCSEMPLDFLKPICHIWTGQNLNLVCDQIPLSSELYQMISTSAGNLTLAFPGAFSVLGEPFIQNDRYSYIRLSFDELHLPNDEFPYISNILQFLFSSDVNSAKHLSMKTRICQPSVRTQIYSAIKQVGGIAVLIFIW